MGKVKDAKCAWQPLDLTDLEYSQELWVAIHDTDERNHQIAMDIWEENGLDLSRNVAANLLPLLGWADRACRMLVS